LFFGRFGWREKAARAKRVEIVTEGNVQKFGCDAARKA
jgi:hypothetical protein